MKDAFEPAPALGGPARLESGVPQLRRAPESRSTAVKSRSRDASEFGALRLSADLRRLLGGDAGLRLGEIIGLEWSDIDLRSKRLAAAGASSAFRLNAILPLETASRSSSSSMQAHAAAVVSVSVMKSSAQVWFSTGGAVNGWRIGPGPQRSRPGFLTRHAV